MSKVQKVVGRQVFDSRGNPTIEVEIFANNLSSKAICPSGASTGTFEAFEKRDKSKKYLGKSVFGSVNIIKNIISKKLKNINIHNQEKIDNILIRLDGTKQKKKIRGKHNSSCFYSFKKTFSKIEKVTSL